MVMEMPSAQCVGQEFVRQYYTLLHEAPDYMHRFYSHDSSFVHGGIEKPGEELPPVMGQAAIHRKILSLNFRDCHAKIRQVDSQATVDKAVVVQVAGELSNAGQPMRRFMQTFVLAPQSPKKYYVHNDIFRYQDEVFHDGIIDSEPEIAEADTTIEEAEKSGEQLEEAYEQQLEQQEDAVTVSNGNTSYPEVEGQDVEPRGDVTEPPEPSCDQEPKHADSGIAPNSSSVVRAAPSDDSRQPVAAALPPQLAPPTPDVGRSLDKRAASPDVARELHQSAVSVPTLPTDVKAAPEPPKQVSWAALASKKTPTSGGTPHTVAPAPAKPQATVKPEIKPELPISRAPLPQRPPRTERVSMDRDNGSQSGDGEEMIRRVRYPDNLQVFIGNLPYMITTEQMKDYFEKFGPVIDVRINKRPVGREVPNYAFIVFESPDSAQKVLEARPLYILDGKLRLNIEEKKQQTEFRYGMTRGSPRGGYRGGSGGPSGRGNMRGGSGWHGCGRGGQRGFSQGRSDDGNNSGDDNCFGDQSHLQ